MNQEKKHIMSGKFTFYSTLIIFVLLFANVALSQKSANEKKYKSRIKIEYFKKGDNTKQIKATLSSRVNRKPVYVENATLNFYDDTDSASLIGTVVTDEKGIAILTLAADYPIGHGLESSVFRVYFEGNDSFKPSSKEINIKDVKLNVEYKVIDSVYTINIMANEIVDGTVGDPVSDVDVYVYVKRLFSLLKVGEGWLQDGQATIEIPNDIPGDSVRNLKFVTMIPEADGYGTIEKYETVKWGKAITPHNKYADESKRALWEPRAPLWMVITLAVLLIGVYFHYLLIGYKLYKISKLGKNESS